MTTYHKLEKRIEKLENDINCRYLEEKINLLENEIKHLKAFIQFQIRNKKNK